MIKSIGFWIANNYQWSLGLLLEIFIAYHVFFLTKRLSMRDKLLHKEAVRKSLENHLRGVEAGLNRKMVLTNSKLVGRKATKDSCAYAEIKSVRSDGVEFFGFIDSDENCKNIYTVYLLPYENIEYVDLNGAFEGNGYPQIFCKFIGLNGTSWTQIRHYRDSSTYHEGSDPSDYRFSRIY